MELDRVIRIYLKGKLIADFYCKINRKIGYDIVEKNFVESAYRMVIKNPLLQLLLSKRSPLFSLSLILPPPPRKL